MLGKIVLASAAAGALVLAITGCSSGSSGHPGTAHTTARPAGSSSPPSSEPSDAAASTPASTISTTTSAAAHNAAAGSVDVCSLLTPAQATALNKVTYSTATPASPATNYRICTYKRTASTDPVDIQSLTVSVISIPGCWSQLRSANGPGKPVAGVGAAAFGTGIGLDIEAGDRCVEISGLTGAELFGNYRPDVAMAKIILAKLK